MKIRTDKRILLGSGIGIGLILLGLLAIQFQTEYRIIFYVGLYLIVIGLITSISALYAATTSKPKTELVADERITRINEKAGYHAGWLIMLAVMILFWADKIWSLNIELKDMCSGVFLVGFYSWLVLRWYYNKKVI